MQFRYGIVTEFDSTNGLVRVNLTDDNIVTDWLPVMVPFAMNDKMSIPVSVNEQVACLMDKQLEDGICLGAVMNDDDKPYAGASENKFGVKFDDGCLIEYDKSTHKLTINTSGEVDVTANKVKVVAAEADVTAAVIKLTGDVTITGALSVAGLTIVAGGLSSGTTGTPISGTGDLTITGNITGGEVIAGGKHLSTHKHIGVQTGGGISGPPQ